jgi:flagellar biosynthesis protein FliR
VDLFADGSAATALLTAARVGGLILIAPMFAARTVPMAIRTAMLVVLTIVLQPVAFADSAGVAPVLTPVTLLSETLIGFAIGLGAALFVGAAEAAGDLLAVQMGLSGAASLDPLTAVSVPVLGQFCHLFALTLMLAMDAHLLMIDSVAASFRYIPVGSPVDASAGLRAMAGLGSTLFVLGLRFAGPVIVTVLIANVALAVLGRAAPQLQIISVAFPLQIGVGLLALTASLPLIATFFGAWPAEYDALITRLLGALRGGG